MRVGSAGYRPHPRQNQDLRDYRIFRILTARVFSDGQALARVRIGWFFGYVKSASRANRNPENPVNPENPDSDKYAAAPAGNSPIRLGWIFRYANARAGRNEILKIPPILPILILTNARGRRSLLTPLS